MRISIVALATPTFDLDGDCILSLVGGDFFQYTQRVNKVPTLDGESSILSRGYSFTDREFQIEARYKEDVFQCVRYMFKYYPYLYFSFHDGAYLAVIESLKNKEKKIILNVLLKEKIDV